MNDFTEFEQSLKREIALDSVRGCLVIGVLPAETAPEFALWNPSANATILTIDELETLAASIDELLQFADDHREILIGH